MVPTATLLMERIEAPMLRSVETTARLTYRFCYVGDSDLHLIGQPCDLLMGANEPTDDDTYVVAFACGCREVVPGWTLSLATQRHQTV